MFTYSYRAVLFLPKNLTLCVKVPRSGVSLPQYLLRRKQRRKDRQAECAPLVPYSLVTGGRHPSSGQCRNWLRRRSPETVRLTVFPWCSNSSKFVTDNSDYVRRFFYNRPHCLRQQRQNQNCSNRDGTDCLPR